MVDADYWTFAGLILQSDTFIIRSVMLVIVKYAIKNTIFCKGQLHEYIS